MKFKLDIPQPYLSIEPVGGKIDSAAYEQMIVAWEVYKSQTMGINYENFCCSF